MENNKKIADELSLIIKNTPTTFDENTFLSLDKANDLYNDLIDRGIIKKRGYTLKGIDESSVFNIPNNNFLSKKL